MTTRYGILSDLHTVHPYIAPIAFETLKQHGAQKVLLNGDIIGDQFPGLSNQDYLAYLLQTAADSGLETYVQPGSHEEVREFQPVMNAFSDKYASLIDATQHPKLAAEDHDLVFLPGSDWRLGTAKTHGFALQRTNAQSGLYESDDRVFGVTNINELADYVTRPEQTVVVAHVPRKFSSLEHGVDVAYFAENEQGGLLPGVILEHDIRQQYGAVSRSELEHIAQSEGFTFKHENRGNEDLATAYDELGITKSVTGHFHEAVHRAHTRDCTPVKPGTYSEQLFWNASYGDRGLAGILHVDENRVAYENIQLPRKLK